jgi:hypothetical protein
LSFFDEADEPPASPSPPRRRSPAGRRPPDAQQAIRNRRIAAAVILLAAIVLIAVGVHACQVSQRNGALKDYNTQVYSLIASSDQTGRQLFELLGSRKRDATALYTQVGEALSSAQTQLNHANAMNVPSEMQAAHDKLVLALAMRRDGIRLIGSQIQQALGTSDRRAAIEQIAAATAGFYASDVVYKGYSVPEMVAVLHAAGISVGGVNGEQIQGGQYVTDLGWLSPSFIASKLGVSLPRSKGASTGLHGHSLNSVSVGGSQLSQSATNYVASNPPPTFTLNVTNGGHFTESNVQCKVSVAGLTDTGTAQISQTTPGETTTCTVTLPTAPPAATYNVTAEVVPVAGESNTTNNYMRFPVKFTG